MKQEIFFSGPDEISWITQKGKKREVAPPPSLLFGYHYNIQIAALFFCQLDRDDRAV